MTNADKIRTMTDEELASCLFEFEQDAAIIGVIPDGRLLDWLKDEELAEWFGVELDCGACERMTKGCGKPCTTYAFCIKHWLNWLKQEAEQ